MNFTTASFSALVIGGLLLGYGIWSAASTLTSTEDWSGLVILGLVFSSVSILGGALLLFLVARGCYRLVKHKEISG